MSIGSEEKSTPEWTDIHTMMAISILLMSIGGGAAWGFGGCMFGTGLWIVIALASNFFKTALWQHDKPSTTDAMSHTITQED